MSTTQPLNRRCHEEYFKGVSPIYRSVLEEMAKIREEFGAKWNELSYEQQCKILDQKIVDEATVRKYEIEKTSNKVPQYYPKLQIKTGQKVISDEKLSARNYSCSWRDEHSAPFTWHTRSQMDLTDNASLNSPNEQSKENLKNDAKPLNVTPFLWHYEPATSKLAPDPPDLVVASMKTVHDRANNLMSAATTYNHVVVKSEQGKEVTGLLKWFRTALNVITGACLPLHSWTAPQKTVLHPSSPFIHPELRPPHVIAKGAKISFPIHNPTIEKSDYTLQIDSKNSALNSNFSVTETFSSNPQTPTESEVSKFKNQEQKNSCVEMETLKFVQERTTLKPETMNELKNKLAARLEISASRNERKETIKNHYSDNFCSALKTEQPKFESSGEESHLNDDQIPKTGFDFLDNW